MTQPTEKSSKKHRSLFGRLTRWLVTIGITLIVLAVAAYAIANYRAASSIREQLAKMRAVGQPLTFAELDSIAPANVERSQDAGPYYEAAMALVQPIDIKPLGYDDGDVRGAMKSGQLKPDMLEQARRWVADDQQTLDLLDRGAALPGCNYDTKIRYGMAVCLPGLNRARALANKASLRTCVLAYEGQGDNAVASAKSELAMLRCFDRQPVLVVFLVKLGCTSLVCGDAQLILERGHASAGSLAELETALAKQEQSIDLRRVFQAERVLMLEIMQNVIAGAREIQLDQSNAPTLPEQWPASFASLPGRLMAANTLPLPGQMIEAVEKGWPGMLDASKAVANQPRSRWALLAGVAAASIARAVKTTGRILGELRSTMIAIRIERYRMANGRLPDSLAQLPNAIDLPKDPFTGESLVYAKTSDGYCVYSLGEDRKDAGPDKLSSQGPNWGIRIRMAGTMPSSMPSLLPSTMP